MAGEESTVMTLYEYSGGEPCNIISVGVYSYDSCIITVTVVTVTVVSCIMLKMFTLDSKSSGLKTSSKYKTPGLGKNNLLLFSLKLTAWVAQ